MQLLSLRIRNFRNIESLAWTPSPGLNLITGDNAQGKTNLLEALHLSILGRSFRTRREEECIPWAQATVDPPGDEGATSPSATAIEAGFRRRFGESCNKVTLVAATGGAVKQVARDGAILARLGDLWENSPVVTFSPGDVELFRDSPAGRRRQLDMTLCQISPNYMTCLRDYQRALKHVNAILKRREGSEQEKRAEAEAYYPLMGSAGAALMRLRSEHLTELRELCAAEFLRLGGGIPFEIEYAPAFRAETFDAEMLAHRFITQHEHNCRLGMVGGGPHRDDFSARLSGKEMGKFGSQGQHRLAALALALGTASRLEKTLNESPILLLDDFGSELDGSRRKSVLGELRGRMQVFITATRIQDLGEPEWFDEIRGIHAGSWTGAPC